MKPASFAMAIVMGLGCSLPLSGQSRMPGLSISHLTGDFYVYTTYKVLEGNPIPSNSMYLVTDRGVVMIDTPWDTTQFQPLLDSIQDRHHQNVVLCISTHFHADRTAGLDFLKQKGVKTFSSKQTFDLCKERNENQSEYYFAHDTTFVLGNHRFQTCFPGEGHTKDNIVVWFDHERVLYGGCLVKSTENNSLGNIEDANLSAWPATMRNAMKRFPNPDFVVPGHYGWKNKHSLKHTLTLLLENERKVKN